MKFHILTLFPEMFSGLISLGVIGRGVANGLLDVDFYNIRDFATDRHRTVDDAPYGGGAGMLMKVEPVARCIDSARHSAPGARLLIATPGGKPFTQAMALELAAEGEIIVLCGRYEGIDHRVGELYAATEFSIGDYVMTGGELAAMVLIDTVGRLVPGVLGSDESAGEESFSDGLLEYPQYTRPPEFRGVRVPETLLSGNHREIAAWRQDQAIQRTAQNRPDLIDTSVETLSSKPGQKRAASGGGK